MIVRWTELASADLVHICDFTEHRFGAAQGRRVALAIEQAAGSLEHMPERGRIGRKPQTRELSIAGLPFVAIYRIDNEAVEVLRILHGAQQWP